MAFISAMPAAPERYMQFYLAELRYKAENKAEKKAIKAEKKAIKAEKKAIKAEKKSSFWNVFTNFMEMNRQNSIKRAIFEINI